MAETGIEVEPHMVEDVHLAFTDPLTREVSPERRPQRQHGFIARRGSLKAWSTSRDAALVMLGFMEGAKKKAADV